MWKTETGYSVIGSFQEMFIAFKVKTFNTKHISYINNFSEGDMHCLPVQVIGSEAILRKTQIELYKTNKL